MSLYPKFIDVLTGGGIGGLNDPSSVNDPNACLLASS
jgi:hypothetical protein